MNTSWIDRFDLFLFDLDGLLVDTEKIHFETFLEAVLEYGEKLDWSFETYCHIAHRYGGALKDHMQNTFPQLLEKAGGWAVIYRRKKELYNHRIQNGKLQLMPYVKEFIVRLTAANKKMAVATNSEIESIWTLVRKLPVLESIFLWITREDYSHPKPAPDCYLKAIVFSGVSQDRHIIGFEDSIRGVLALKKAGVLPIFVGKKPQEAPELKEVRCFEHFGVVNVG